MAINGQEQENDRLANAVKARKQQAANAATSGHLASKNKSSYDPLANRSRNNFRPGFNGGSASSSSDDLDENSSDNEKENLNNNKEEDKSNDLFSSNDNLNNNNDGLDNTGAGGLGDSNNGKANLKGDGLIPKKLSKKIILYAGIGAAGFFGIILVFTLIFGVLSSVGDAFKSFITNAVDGFVDFFTKDQIELEKDYYNTLADLQYQRYKSENVCVDANLITAALTVESEFNNNDLNARSQTQISPEEEDTEELTGSGNALDYKRMKKQIALLVGMQIKHKRYSWDTRLNTGGGYCKPSTEGTSYENMTEDTKQYRKLPPHLQQSLYFDSSTPEKVAMNDLKGFFNFLRKKSSQEKNFEYVFYQPAATRECVTRDDKGNCVAYGDVCRATSLPNDEAVLSIGDDADILNTMEDGVFYWNLINSFIPNYYKDILPTVDGPEKDEKIKEIAVAIYQLYKDMGPSKECTEKGPSIVSSDANLCTQGITVVTKDSSGNVIDVTTHDFEEYVAGVVAAENAWYEGDNIENMKAQAIAARTYALAVTDNCQKTIMNGQSHQAYKPTSDPNVIRAAQETKGMVVKKNGRIFLTEYDALCIQSITGDIHTIRQKGQQIPKSFLQSMTWKKGKTYADIDYCYGHGRGMSQIGSRYLQRTGSTYDQILAYYYGSDIEISQSVPDVCIIPKTTEIISGTVEEELLARGHTLLEYNAAISSAVRQSGWATRNGAAAAASAAICKFYEMTGKKLPYHYGGGHDCPTGSVVKGCAQVYGIPGDWKKGYHAVDCSTFVSWSIYNGGFAYYGLNSGTWSTRGTLRNWGPGVSITDAQPGDLISSDGHIQIIIGADETGYTVAHASSTDTGLWTYHVGFTSAGHYNIVDMSVFYGDESKKVEDPDPQPQGPEVPDSSDSDPSTGSPGTVISGTYSNYNYYLYAPSSVSDNSLIVYLHGIGGAGTDKSLLKKEGEKAFLNLIEDSGISYNTYILVPQTPVQSWNETTIMGLIQKIVSDNSINTNKISIWGYSLGALSAQKLVAANPSYFSSAVIISTNNTSASGFSTIPTYAITGTSDTWNSGTVGFIDAIKKAGNTNAHIKSYPNQSHGGLPMVALTDTSFDGGYSSLVGWSIAQTK